MGISVSSTYDLSTNEFLLKFVSKEHISPDDPFWNTFLTFNIKRPYSSTEQLALDTRLEPICQNLLANNLHSGNLGALIHVLTSRSNKLSEATNFDNSVYCWQIYNALFLLRCTLKYLTETVTEEQFIEHVDQGTYSSHSNLETLIGALIAIVVDVPLTEITYAVHLEAVICLLVILSVQLHNNRRADHSNVYRLILKGKHSIHAPLFIKSLLRNFIEQRKSMSCFDLNQGHSLMLGLASGLWSLLTFSKNSNETVNGKDFQIAPLATQSLLLILVLTNHCTMQNNTYRESLFTCVNSQDNNPIPPTMAPSVFRTDYEALYTTLCHKVNGDSATLLLYILLHRNPSFKAFLLAREDLERLIIPILKTLYHAPNSNSHHIYMSLIILLILSENDGFNRSIHEMKLKHVTWYTERSITEISLGGLLVLIVIRTIQYNIFKMRDKYLHTNCLAALANMSSQFRDLHPYVSQRLISLFETLAKKHQKLIQILRTTVPSYQDTAVTLVQENVNVEQDLDALEEVLRMLLEIFNSCLSNQLVNNPNLIYTLLYKKDVFEPFSANPRFQDIVQNVKIIVKYFSQLLQMKSQQNEVDATQVLLIIQQGAKQWSKEKIIKFPDLKFKYVEENQPEDFFIPYVWALVNQKSMLHWSTEENPTVLTC